jgi:hypothetical protein
MAFFLSKSHIRRLSSNEVGSAQTLYEAAVAIRVRAANIGVRGLLGHRPVVAGFGLGLGERGALKEHTLSGRPWSSDELH